MNKRGQAFPIWNIDVPGHHHDSVSTMYTSIPFFVGLQVGPHVETARAYGVLIDHTGKIDVDMGKTEELTASMTVEGDSLVVYFFAGPAIADVLRQYSELTGHMPLPARWTLGHHQSRWSYMSERQVDDIANRLRTGHHPCDAIWLDIDYMDGYKNFTFNPDRFPDPASMANRLHQHGFHLVTILDPGTKVDGDYDVYRQGLERDYFCRNTSGELFIGTVWPGACVFPDFSRSDVRGWWGSLYKRLLDQGVDAIWNDMDESALTNPLIEL
jgi:alpha-glucosidase